MGKRIYEKWVKDALMTDNTKLDEINILKSMEMKLR